MHIIVKRKLNDYDSWKKLVSDYDGMRKQYGSKGARVYRIANDPNEVIIVFEWDDAKPFKTYFDLPDVRKALANSGTTEIFEVSESFFLEE
jgi:heme-degrading monooxygenase HmoA